VVAFLFLATRFLAYSSRANDNFKRVASTTHVSVGALLGIGITALIWR